MLENTFIHLPNFNSKHERRFWESGILTWDDFLDKFGSSPYHKQYCSLLASSSYAFKLGDWDHFASLLPNNEIWRLFPSVSRIGYLDIETTGLGKNEDYVTVIGLYDGNQTLSYVYGQNLADFEHDIKDYDMLVTFNGSVFDIPFLRKVFPSIKLPRLHADLRFLLASLNVRGGLKNIEKSFGFSREPDLEGLNGYDAVKMWRAYSDTGNKDQLDKLVRYNSADITNLKALMEWSYTQKRLRTGFDEFAAKSRVSDSIICKPG